MDAQNLWKATLESLKEKVSKPSFETWLKSTQAQGFENNMLTIEVPNDFSREWLANHYKTIISDSLQSLTGTTVHIQFVTPLDVEVEDKPLNANLQDEEGTYSDPSQLNPRYTFSTFVIGAGNRFAHAASLAVAETPAKAYNPLFIYGGVGLGKTHLMHAIGHHVQAHTPSSRVVYISSERFTNEFINCILEKAGDQFRNKYRSVDVLLIDDIQFLAGKEQTQEEFFHTFNALHENNKQIIISSDRPPKEIPTLENRLRSRFEWGLLTDIQPPDLETRIAILRKKAIADNLDISNEVLAFIAGQVVSNIRELEGALIRVVAYSALMNRPIDFDLAAQALKEIVAPANPKTISIQGIQEAVGSYFKLPVDELISKSRTKQIAFARQVAMYLSRELTDHSLPKIGTDFGRDHTTVIHAHEKIRRMMSDDPHLDKTMTSIKNKLMRSGFAPVDK